MDDEEVYSVPPGHDMATAQEVSFKDKLKAFQAGTPINNTTPQHGPVRRTKPALKTPLNPESSASPSNPARGPAAFKVPSLGKPPSPNSNRQEFAVGRQMDNSPTHTGEFKAKLEMSLKNSNGHGGGFLFGNKQAQDEIIKNEDDIIPPGRTDKRPGPTRADKPTPNRLDKPTPLRSKPVIPKNVTKPPQLVKPSHDLPKLPDDDLPPPPPDLPAPDDVPPPLPSGPRPNQMHSELPKPPRMDLPTPHRDLPKLPVDMPPPPRDLPKHPVDMPTPPRDLPRPPVDMPSPPRDLPKDVPPPLPAGPRPSQGLHNGFQSESPDDIPIESPPPIPGNHPVPLRPLPPSLPTVPKMPVPPVIDETPPPIPETPRPFVPNRTTPGNAADEPPVIPPRSDRPLPAFPGTLNGDRPLPPHPPQSSRLPVPPSMDEPRTPVVEETYDTPPTHDQTYDIPPQSEDTYDVPPQADDTYDVPPPSDEPLPKPPILPQSPGGNSARSQSIPVPPALDDEVYDVPGAAEPVSNLEETYDIPAEIKGPRKPDVVARPSEVRKVSLPKQEFLLEGASVSGDLFMVERTGETIRYGAKTYQVVRFVEPGTSSTDDNFIEEYNSDDEREDLKRGMGRPAPSRPPANTPRRPSDVAPQKVTAAPRMTPQTTRFQGYNDDEEVYDDTDDRKDEEELRRQEEERKMLEKQRLKEEKEAEKIAKKKEREELQRQKEERDKILREEREKQREIDREEKRIKKRQQLLAQLKLANEEEANTVLFKVAAVESTDIIVKVKSQMERFLNQVNVVSVKVGDEVEVIRTDEKINGPGRVLIRKTDGKLGYIDKRVLDLPRETDSAQSSGSGQIGVSRGLFPEENYEDFDMGNRDDDDDEDIYEDYDGP